MFTLILFAQIAAAATGFITTSEDALQFLEKTYSLNSIKINEYKASVEEAKVVSLAFDHVVQREHNEADLHYKEVRAKYPNSPKAALDHIMYYIWRKRWEQAQELSSSSAKKFSNDISFQIVEASLKKRKSYTDKEMQNQAMAEMDVLLAAWNDFRLGRKSNK